PRRVAAPPPAPGRLHLLPGRRPRQRPLAAQPADRPRADEAGAARRAGRARRRVAPGQDAHAPVAVAVRPRRGGGAAADRRAMTSRPAGGLKPAMTTTRPRARE